MFSILRCERRECVCVPVFVVLYSGCRMSMRAPVSFISWIVLASAKGSCDPAAVLLVTQCPERKFSTECRLGPACATLPKQVSYPVHFFFFLLSHFCFPASGQAVVTTGVVPSPRYSIFIAHRHQQSHCSSIFHQVLLTHAVVLSASQFVHKKKSPRMYTSMHSGGFELTKLTYTRLKDNLIRHRGDGLPYNSAATMVIVIASCSCVPDPQVLTINR